MNKDKLIKIINILFILSIILELECFYNSISTLIRIIIISILFILVFLFYANKKERQYLLAYFLALILYIILHLFNIKDSNVLSELLYFYKMLMNVFILFIIYKLNYKLDNFKNVLKISILLIGLSIIICNIFKIGYTSYELVNPKYNIFDWFRGNNFYLEASSRGYFSFTNQISSIMLLYYSTMLIILEKENTWKNFFILMVGLISLIILGTRVSTYGPLIMSIISLISYLLIYISRRYKINISFIIKIVILIIINISLYFISPLYSRNLYYQETYEPKDTPLVDQDIKEDTSRVENKVKDNLLSLLKDSRIDEDFYLEYYPYKLDREFYRKFVKLDDSKRLNVRYLEKEIIKRVKYLNNNELDSYLGLGYNRVINIFNIENDYVMQYYSIGIIGSILTLGVNILLVLFCYFKVLFNLNRYLNYKNVMLLGGITFSLACSYFTGNILNSISCIIPISLLVGLLINELKYKDKLEYEYYLGLKTTTKGKKEILSKIFDGNRYILYNINPLICYNFRKNNKDKFIINKEIYNIPDGNGIVLLSKLRSGNITSSIPGIDMLYDICYYSVKNKYSIYLYGTTKENIEESYNILKDKYKGINIVGYSNGYEDSLKVLEDIKKSKPDILFVGLGSPKQERFIIDNDKCLSNIKIIMPVGGSFDVISGNISRAPKIIRKIKLEWLYRMIKEPRRFKYIGKIFMFIFLALFSDVCYNDDGGKNEEFIN